MKDSIVDQIQTIESSVKEILETNVDARSDDYILYSCLIQKRYKDISLNNSNIKEVINSFCRVLNLHNEYNLPNFSTVIRTRRKVQKENTHLIVEDAKTKRAERESTFNEYYGQHGTLY